MMILPRGFGLSLSKSKSSRELTPAGVIRLVWSRMKDSVTSDISLPTYCSGRPVCLPIAHDATRRVTSKL